MNFQVRQDSPKPKNKASSNGIYDKGYLILIFSFVAISSIISYSFYHALKISRNYSPLVDAAMEVQLQSTSAHLWFEEILSGDSFEKMETVWEHQGRAEWYAKALLYGGETAETIYIPLKVANLRQKVTEVIDSLKSFEEITEVRLDTIAVSGSGTAIDQQYDKVFNNLIDRAEDVKTELYRMIGVANKRFIWTQIAIILTTCIVFLFSLLFYRKTSLFKKNALEEMQEKNDALIKEMQTREQSQAQLLDSERRYSRLVENLNDVVFRLTLPDARFEFISDSAIGLFGISPAELHDSTKLFKTLIHPESKEEFNAFWEKMLQGQAQNYCEYRIISRSSGKVKWLSQRNSTITDGKGKAIAVEGIITDVSFSKNMEDERLSLERQMLHAQKLESLGVLAGGIAHDFNNLLMAILGNADLALQELSPHAPARENIDAIEKASRRAASLAKQMLAYSGKGKFIIEPIELNEFVQEMAHMLEVSISKKAVLKFNFADNIPVFEGDPTQIRQVIMNLIINASEAIEDMSGIIAISTGAMVCTREYLETTDFAKNFGLTTQLPEGVYVYLEVADTGCGMDLETQQKLFDPFFTTKFTGRGLGMAAVQGILRGLGASIKVYSEVGKGTTFKILFPVTENTLGSDLKSVGDGEVESVNAHGTVLIADDEETVCAVGKMMLERIGFKVLTAANGRQAVEVFKQHSNAITLVLLDLTMPHLGGEEVFREIRLIKPDAKVIISSGYNEMDTTQQFAGKGLAGFIQKPYTSKELKALLADVLKN